MPALPPSRGPGRALPDEVEELPDDAILEQDLRSAPTQSEPTRPRGVFLEEEIIELGQDAIVAEERSAHRPQPRTPVLQEYSSVVIAEEALEAAGHAPRVSDKTVVVRDRRPLASTPRIVEREVGRARRRERALFVSAGLLAALLGTGLVVWLSSGSDKVEPSETLPAASAEASPESAAKRVTPPEAEPSEAAPERDEPAEETPENADPPRLSVDQLPLAPTHPEK